MIAVFTQMINLIFSVGRTAFMRPRPTQGNWTSLRRCGTATRRRFDMSAAFEEYAAARAAHTVPLGEISLKQGLPGAVDTHISLSQLKNRIREVHLKVAY